jgi:hypothetical protein
VRCLEVRDDQCLLTTWLEEYFAAFCKNGDGAGAEVTAGLGRSQRTSAAPDPPKPTQIVAICVSEGVVFLAVASSEAVVVDGCQGKVPFCRPVGDSKGSACG